MNQLDIHTKGRRPTLRARRTDFAMQRCCWDFSLVKFRGRILPVIPI